MIPRADAPHPPRDAKLSATLVAVALSGAALALGTLAWLGPRGAVSVAIGAALATGNLWALGRVVTALLESERGRSSSVRGGGRWAVMAVLKMFGLFAVVWLLMHYAVVAPLAMLAGFGALPIGIAIGSMVSNRSSVSEP